MPPTPLTSLTPEGVQLNAIQPSGVLYRPIAPLCMQMFSARASARRTALFLGRYRARAAPYLVWTRHISSRMRTSCGGGYTTC